METLNTSFQQLHELKDYQERVDAQLNATDTGIDGESCGVPLVVLQNETHNAIQAALDSVNFEVGRRFKELISQRKEKGSSFVNNGLKAFIDTLQPLLDRGTLGASFLLKEVDNLGEDIRIFVGHRQGFNLDAEKHPNGIVSCQGCGNTDFVAAFQVAPQRPLVKVRQRRV